MSKVVNMFEAKKAKKEENAEENNEELYFKEIMEKNRKTQERLAKERNSTNKSVLRSYRIKH